MQQEQGDADAGIETMKEFVELTEENPEALERLMNKEGIDFGYKNKLKKQLEIYKENEAAAEARRLQIRNDQSQQVSKIYGLLIQPCSTRSGRIVQMIARALQLQNVPLEIPDIVQQKLDKPDLKLAVEDSLKVLHACVELGRAAANRAEGGHAIAIIGNTGAGKSTFANYMHGWSLCS